MKQSTADLLVSLDRAFPLAFETEVEKRLPELIEAASKWTMNPSAEAEETATAEPPASSTTPRARASKDETSARAEKILSNATHHETFVASDAARWAGIDARTVSPILRGLVELGKLTKTGEKRNTVYSLASS